MDLYADNILDHYRHPRNTGVLQGATVAWQEINVSCGDTLKVFLNITDGRIDNVSWEGTGCAISQASMSLLSEELLGKSLDDVTAISPQYVRDLLGVPVGTRRTKCAFLSLHALKNALRQLDNKEPQDWAETLKE